MLTIRIATINDISLINRLAQQVFPATYRGILAPEQMDYMMDMMYSPESLTRQISEERHQYFIAYTDGEPCGYLSIEPETESLYHLQKIYVLPRFQGKKVGRFLIEYALWYIKSFSPHKPVTVELNVNRNNRAKIFYEHMGFHIDRSGDFPIGNGYYMNDYIMTKEL